MKTSDFAVVIGLMKRVRAFTLNSPRSVLRRFLSPALSLQDLFWTSLAASCIVRVRMNRATSLPSFPARKQRERYQGDKYSYFISHHHPTIGGEVTRSLSMPETSASCKIQS